jgi:hypothetical protein
MVVTFATALRTGGEYMRNHARMLKRQVEAHSTEPCRFVCLSDVEIDGVETVKLQHNWPGWWSCVELWRLDGPVIVFGLDTVIVGSLDKYIEYARQMPSDVFLLPEAPYRQYRGLDGYYINGVQIWNGDWSWLVDRFNYEVDSKRFRGDENYLLYQLFENDVEIRSINKELGGVVSYSLEYTKGSDASIVYFHGQHKPWNKPGLWRNLVKNYA